MKCDVAKGSKRGGIAQGASTILREREGESSPTRVRFIRLHSAESHAEHLGHDRSQHRSFKKKSEVVKTDQRERESDTLKSPVSASREGEKRTYTLPPTFGQANNNQHSIHGTRMETSAGLRLGSHHGESTLKVHLSAKCKEDVR